MDYFVVSPFPLSGPVAHTSVWIKSFASPVCCGTACIFGTSCLLFNGTPWKKKYSRKIFKNKKPEKTLCFPPTAQVVCRFQLGYRAVLSSIRHKTVISSSLRCKRFRVNRLLAQKTGGEVEAFPYIAPFTSFSC